VDANRVSLLAEVERYAAAESEVAEPLEEELVALVPSYLEARRHEVGELKDLLSTENFPAIRAIAHNLKGTGTSYGFPHLTTLGAAMQVSAEYSEAGELGAEIRALGEFLAKDAQS
jgi:hypothetical protein